MTSETQSEFEPAWERARACLAPAERFRIEGAGPEEPELAAIDWGGEGPLLFLHHANGFCAAMWAPIAQLLSDRFRVVALDARGHGDSEAVPPDVREGAPDPYGWDLLASDAQRAIRATLARTGRERVDLALGHSFGGALLLRAASRAGTPIDRLLLMDPVLLPARTREERVAQSRGTSLAAATRRRRDVFPSAAEAYAHCRARGLFAPFTPECLALYAGEGMREMATGEVTLKCAKEVEASIFDGGGIVDCAENVEEFAGRALFVHAERGNFDRAHYDAIVARMPSAEVVGADLGHLFPFEVPTEAVRFVETLMG